MNEIFQFSETDMPQEFNQWLDYNDGDLFYHLGFDKNWIGLEWAHKWKTVSDVFWDTTKVCMGGSHERAQRFAQTMNREKQWLKWRRLLKPRPIGKTERFSLYKEWKTISVSHGMGMPSMSILLHEISKLLYYAKWKDIQRLRDEVSFIRIGTSWWVGIDWWTVVVAENGMNAMWEHQHESIKLWDRFLYPTNLNQDLSTAIAAANIAGEVWKVIDLVRGDTVGTGDFYEEQWRVDGFFDPWYSETDKLRYLEELYEKWARNFEMESTYFASFCLRAGIPGAIVCVALLNRFNWDQVTADLWEISQNAELVVLNYLRKVRAI